MPLALYFGSEAGSEIVADALKNRFLPFLNVARFLSNSAFAILVWRLLAHSQRLDRGQIGLAVTGNTRALFRKILCLLLPLCLCFVISGMLGYLFFARMLSRGAYAEYMHLGLTIFFPLSAILLSKYGPPLLRAFLGVAIFCFMAAPFFMRPEYSPTLVKAAFTLSSSGQQALFFFGTLAFVLLAPQAKRPTLVLCLAWLAAIAAIPGNLLASQVLPWLGLSLYSTISVLSGVGLLSIVVLLRAFPLPAPFGKDKAVDSTDLEAAKLHAAQAEATARAEAAKLQAAAYAEAARLEALHRQEEARRRSFAAAFDLSAREESLLSGLLDGQRNAELAARLAISERTIRFHLGGLLKKTRQNNRKRLLHFYTTWQQ